MAASPARMALAIASLFALSVIPAAAQDASTSRPIRAPSRRSQTGVSIDAYSG